MRLGGKKLPLGGVFLPLRQGGVFVKSVFVRYFTWYES